MLQMAAREAGEEVYGGSLCHQPTILSQLYTVCPPTHGRPLSSNTGTAHKLLQRVVCFCLSKLQRTLRSSTADFDSSYTWLLMAGYLWLPVGCSCHTERWSVCHTVKVSVSLYLPWGRAPYNGYSVQSSAACFKSAGRERAYGKPF